MNLDTAYLKSCNEKLAEAYRLLLQSDKKDIHYELYRSAAVKEFEVLMEQSGKLLKKVIAPYFHSKKAADALSYKAVFRHAGKYQLLTIEEVARWLRYRDNRNRTAHDYGVDLAEQTLPLIPLFMEDVNALIAVIERQNHPKK